MIRIIFLGINLLFVSFSWAQNKDMRNISPADKTQKYIKAWTKELTLTQDQQTKAQPIALKMFTKIYALRADTTMERKDRRQAMMIARKEGSDAFRALLTTEQATLYDKKMQEIMDKKGDRKGGKPADGKGQNKGMKKAADEELGNDDLF